MPDYLPGEIIEQILLRLPVKTLIKFTTVCKSWLSLIKAPTFIQSHLRATIESNNQNDAHLLLLSAYSFSREEGICHEHHWLHWDSPEFEEYTKLPNPLSFFTPKKKPDELSVIGTCNGIICLQSEYSHILWDRSRSPILIWNPSIKKIVKLTKPLAFRKRYSTGGYSYRKYAPLGFYYDPHSNEYKVLRIMLIRFEQFRLSSDVQLYSLARGSWRRLGTSVAPVDLLAEGWERPIFVNGCWHMSKVRSPGGDSFISYFNFATEVFGEIMIPEALRRNKCSISRYEDSLAVIRHYDYLINGSSCDIWVMKQYGVAESWTCLFNLPVFTGSIHGFKRCGEVVLYEIKDCGRSKMISFDPETNQVRVFGSDDYLYDFMDSFVESLVLLDHAKAISTDRIARPKLLKCLSKKFEKHNI